ncbi:MAG: GTP-binding protein [Myxococcota bacterium]
MAAPTPTPPAPPDAPDASRPGRATRIPALVLSGFLGSGKTTLVQRLLRDARRSGLRIALVSNELGALGIDRALLGAGEQAYVELEGGCVCCELSDDLVETLARLEREVAPDRFVIETSGVALPYDTQLNFFRPPVRDFIGDDIAVVVVNAEQLAEGRDLEGTFEDQVQSADLLVLNKLDLVPESEWDAIEARLRAIEPDAPIVRAVRGDVDPRLLFPPDLGERDRLGPPPEPAPHGHAHYVTGEWRPEAGLSCETLRDALAGLDLLRAKGFVVTDEGLRLVQVVGRRVEIEPPPEPPPAALIGRIVTIRRARPDEADPASDACPDHDSASATAPASSTASRSPSTSSPRST